ncbi:MAG: Farnesyl diphosphate synthase [Microgenomates bacterium OLB22]|nr:MAG: Farnesyl diphosphate synthase [Microgenomates bacterium OLB22]
MVIPTLLTKHREAILARSKNFFDEIHEARPLRDKPLDDVIETLSTFITKGKLLRGCMLMEMYELLSGKPGSVMTSAGLGIECLHTSLLIHDDVIDHDTYRRNVPTVHIHYQAVASKENIPDSTFYGQMIATILGDMGFFLGLRLINQVLDEKTATRIHEMLTRELWLVGEAELFDFHYGVASEEPSNETIETIYRYKTGRYTFSLPLCIGAMLAEADSDTISLLEQYGEHIGVIFQIKDDELGFLGLVKILAKRLVLTFEKTRKQLSGSYSSIDLMLLRQTLHTQFFGKKEVSPDEFKRLYELCEKYDIYQSLASWIHHEEKKALAIVDESPFSESTRSFLRQLVEFNVTRTR